MSQSYNKKSPYTFTSTFFSVKTVKTLTHEDFELKSKEKIAIKYDDCIVILFYNENDESKAILDIWGSASSKTPGVVFAACNLQIEKEVAKAFVDLRSEHYHPLSWVKLDSVPFIIAYNKGWPIETYHDKITLTNIIDYSMSLVSQHRRERKPDSILPYKPGKPGNGPPKPVY
jgi:hypothetical protein